MIRTFKVLSLLLSYPTEALQEAAPEFRAAVESEGLVPAKRRTPLFALIDEIAGRDLYDLQERYILLFDRTRSLGNDQPSNCSGTPPRVGTRIDSQTPPAPTSLNSGICRASRGSASTS